MKKIDFLIIFFILFLNFGSASADRIRGPLEDNYDRWGSDYKVIETEGSWYDGGGSCQLACTRDPVCKAWTYVKRNAQGSKPKCYLKNAIPASTPNPCCTSGMIIEKPFLTPELLYQRFIYDMPAHCGGMRWCASNAMAAMKDSKLTQNPIKLNDFVAVGNNHDTSVIVFCSQFRSANEALIDIVTSSSQENVNSALYWRNEIEKKIKLARCL